MFWLRLTMFTVNPSFEICFFNIMGIYEVFKAVDYLTLLVNRFLSILELSECVNISQK